MSEADTRKEAKSFCCTPGTTAGRGGEWEGGPRKERIAGTIFLPPDAAQTRGGWAQSPSSVFLFSCLLFPSSQNPGEHCPSSCVLSGRVPPRPARSTSAGLLWCIGRRASHYPRRSARREALQRRRRPAAGLAPLPAAGEAGVQGAVRSPANPRGLPGGGSATGGWTCPAGRRGRRRGCRGAALAAAQACRHSLTGRGSQGTPPPPVRRTRRLYPETSSACPGSRMPDRAWGRAHSSCLHHSLTRTTQQQLGPSQVLW